MLLVPQLECVRYPERNKWESTDVLYLFISLIRSMCSSGLQKALNPLCSVKGAPYQDWLNLLLGNAEYWRTVASTGSTPAGCHLASKSTIISSQSMSEFCYGTNIHQRLFVWEYRRALSEDLKNKTKYVWFLNSRRLLCIWLVSVLSIFKKAGMNVLESLHIQYCLKSWLH